MKKRMSDREFILRDKLRMLRSAKKRLTYQLDQFGTAMKELNKKLASIKVELAEMEEKPSEVVAAPILETDQPEPEKPVLESEKIFQEIVAKSEAKVKVDANTMTAIEDSKPVKKPAKKKYTSRPKITESEKKEETDSDEA